MIIFLLEIVLSNRLKIVLSYIRIVIFNLYFKNIINIQYIIGGYKKYEEYLEFEIHF